MKYELVGRLVFEARDISEAFSLLAKHFTLLAEGNESDLPEQGTSMAIKRADVPTPVPPADAVKTRRRKNPRRKV